MTELTISTSEISSTLKKTLTSFNENVQKAVKRQTNKSAKELKELIQSNARKRTQKYSRSWRVKLTENTSFRYSKKVYSHKEYPLTHLLENGHALRRGGRAIGKVKAYKHIAPSFEKIQKSYVENIQEEITKLS